MASLVVSSMATAAAFAILMVLGGQLFGSDAGLWATIALAVYPMSVFLIAPFTESLFLALTLAAVLLAYRKSWLPTGAFALLASLSRGPGMLLSIPLALLAWRDWSFEPGRKSVCKAVSLLAAVAAPLAGGLGFLGWRSWAGFPSMNATVLRYAGTAFVDPVTGVTAAIRQWLTVLDLPTTLDLAAGALLIGMTVAMLIVPRWRKPELLAYMLANAVFLLSRRTEGASSLKSLSRYTVVLFPAFLVVGEWLGRARRWTRFVYLAVSSAVLLAMSALYSLWFFLG